MNKTQQLLQERSELFEKLWTKFLELQKEIHAITLEEAHDKRNNVNSVRSSVAKDNLSSQANEIFSQIKSFHATTISLLLTSLKDEVDLRINNLFDEGRMSLLNDNENGQYKVLSDISTLLSETISDI